LRVPDPSAHLRFESIGLDSQYRTGERDPVEGFYRPCLRLAANYDRAVGYFRSTVFLVIGEPLLSFARRGGRLRLVCSPSITEEDAKAIVSGYLRREDVFEQALGRDIDLMLGDESCAYRTRVLATLVKSGSLDIRLALRPDASGIYHEKIGIFTDGCGQRASFLGSANETWSAWHKDGNHESIEVFREWIAPSEADRVKSHAAHFERLWAGEVAGVETMPFPEAQRRRLLDFALASLDEVEHDRLIESPLRRQPLPHQISAIDAWERAGRRGVFEHATGSGKTFTALTAIKKHVATGAPALILVPSQLLLEQWKGEIEAELPGATLLLAGAGHTKWKEIGRLGAMTGSDVDEPRVVLATMQTAASGAFLRAMRGGDHLMLVADEVHQMGSPFNARAMAIKSGASLGLSATPNRFGDPIGTARIFERFGPLIPPAITLQDAIKSGRLVDYEYYPHPIHLDEEEREEWKSLTRKISLEIAMAGQDEGRDRRFSEKVKMLLIRRSRIAKKARAKPALAAAVISNAYQEGQRWLIYCEDSQQVEEVMDRLRLSGLKPVEYHMSMGGDRPAALEWFRRFGGALVSIKCLDEGIDIPAVSHALILASSQNPRQFIQRRGRVLRKARGKHLAVIHDAIVVPVNLEDEPEQASLLKAEFLRALQFADSAMNKMAGVQLRSMAISMGLDLEEDSGDGIEEETE
jgi:superfamily II DNA or RNA helicase